MQTCLIFIITGKENSMLELLKKRKSVRNFSLKAVEKKKIDMLLQAALLSPSSRNHDPWKFIAVTDKDLIAELSGSKKSGSAFLKNAPLVIAVTADTEKSDVWVEDSSIASILIQLEAESLGLGSCWVQIRKREADAGEKSEDYVKRILNIPEKHGVVSLIGIGYPEKEEERIPKKTDTEKCRLNSFSSSYNFGK